jgi:hypothetical protein
MSHAIVGVVDNVTTKTKTTRVGDKIINYITVNGIEVSTGFKAAHHEGEMVNIAVKFNFGEWQKIEGKTGDGLPPCDGAKPVTAVKPSGRFGGNKGTFPVSPTDGQMSIIRQNSMNRAVEILENWMTSSAPLFEPKSQDEYMKKLHKVALTITDFNSGGDIMKMIAASGMKSAVNE